MHTNNPFPRYVCFKEVNGGKITDIRHNSDGGATLTFNELSVPVTVTVDDAWMVKFKPVVGGYYVIYEDGYTSFSPTHAFENGYRLKETA